MEIKEIEIFVNFSKAGILNVHSISLPDNSVIKSPEIEFLNSEIINDNNFKVFKCRYDGGSCTIGFDTNKLKWFLIE